ncbi:hypothetical protein EDD85DRAFT_956194 [Armillaria nabsnona]|nr:hypothetical protein EDD85DRAFT_956194 [Armillaria nabsnona]
MTEDVDPATPESLQVPKDRDDSRFWAVLIGVDGDPHYPLHGCMSDAEPMEKYLVEDLGVPSDHIQHLLGPTGGKPPMDNIIVYFAGNGARYDAEEYYYNRVLPEVSLVLTKPLNALRPLDRAARDDNRSEILDISVREIEAIFT